MSATPKHAGGSAASPSAAGRRSHVRVRAGRIIEVRVLRFTDLHDVERLNAEVLAAVHQAGPGAFLYADHRFASPIARDIADAWARGMRAANPGLARSAILLDPSNVTFNLQLERIVRCACNSARRSFYCKDELLAWMDRGTTDLERAALPFLFSDDHG